MNPKEQILAAAAAIVDNFGHHRTAEYFAGFAADATFVFYTHTARLNSRAEYEALWASWESDDGFHVHGCRSRDQHVQLMGESAAVFTHYVESDIEFGSETSTIRERETIVFEHRNGSWLAVHEHLSPEAAG
ncbi:MAG: nuclear transport factor 2 family protein [Microbacteriaceae bacterium]|nr:nuclear transport factor 2 family protein [Microbacteriaceae bacterium]